MSTTIVPQLVRKDFHLMRRMIATHVAIGLVSMAILPALIGRMPDWVFMNLGFVLLVGPAATFGIVLLMKTNVFEKEKATQRFIMSLPVTIGEFTRAKLLVNIPAFAAFWLASTAVAFHFAFGRGLLPAGAVPFITMVFVGGFAAYACILAASLLFQSVGVTVLAIWLFELTTTAYLWAVAYFEPVRRHVWGPVAVWNGAALGIVGAQLGIAVLAIVATVYFQGRKRDFA